MTTFSRDTFAFNVQGSVGTTVPDFRVSTNGRLEVAVVNASLDTSAQSPMYIPLTDVNTGITVYLAAFTTLVS